MVSRFLLIGAAAAMLFGGLTLSNPTPVSAEEAGIELAQYWGPPRHYRRPPPPPPPGYWRGYRRYDYNRHYYRPPPPPPPYWRHHRRYWY